MTVVFQQRLEIDEQACWEECGKPRVARWLVAQVGIACSKTLDFVLEMMLWRPKWLLTVRSASFL